MQSGIRGRKTSFFGMRLCGYQWTVIQKGFQRMHDIICFTLKTASSIFNPFEVREPIKYHQKVLTHLQGGEPNIRF